MNKMNDTLADLSPLEQRRTRLRAFADRVLEAVEALPMPKTATDAERTLRTVTAADRMLVQLYKRITPLQQIDLATANRSSYPSYAPRLPKPPEPEEDPEPLSPEAQTALDLEQRANDIFARYLKAIAEEDDSDIPQQTTGPP